METTSITPSNTPSSWSRKQLLTTVAVAALVTLVIVQAYTLVLVIPARTVNGAGTSTTTTAPNTITVQGTGHASVKPDTAIVNIGVQTQSSTVQTAVQDNANTMSQVITALNNIGIDNTNIQTEYYNVSPVYTYNTGVPPTLNGYQVNNQIQVTILSSGQTVSQLGTKAGQVIDTAVAAGANQLNGVQFTASQSVFGQAEQSALTDAGKDASLQAHTIAAALGVSVTGLVSVTTGNNNYYQPPIYTASISGASSTPVVAPNSLSVTETIQAVFSIN